MKRAWLKYCLEQLLVGENAASLWWSRRSPDSPVYMEQVAHAFAAGYKAKVRS